MPRNFDRWMESHQTEWRSHHVTSAEWGQQNGKLRSWILPRELWEEGLWPGIRTGSDNSLSKYLADEKIQKHTGVHNLKSSWVFCANLYFPFRASAAGRDLLAAFLRRRVDGEIESLESIELEYAHPGELSPKKLLGERDGRRGANQTSPDLGLCVNKGNGLVLVENKFTEKNFERCSGWKHTSNPERNRCKDAVKVARDPSGQCHLVTWNRRYWDHLEPVVDHEALMDLPACPAARSGYQLFRQQALAEGIAQSGKYALVVSAVAVDERNENLEASLGRSGIDGLKGWGRIFRGKAKFAEFTHQEWVGWVREHQAGGQWDDWLSYVRDRYALG